MTDPRRKIVAEAMRAMKNPHYLAIAATAFPVAAELIEELTAKAEGLREDIIDEMDAMMLHSQRWQARAEKAEATIATQAKEIERLRGFAQSVLDRDEGYLCNRSTADLTAEWYSVVCQARGLLKEADHDEEKTDDAG